MLANEAADATPGAIRNRAEAVAASDWLRRYTRASQGDVATDDAIRILRCAIRVGDPAPWDDIIPLVRPGFAPLPVHPPAPDPPRRSPAPGAADHPPQNALTDAISPPMGGGPKPQAVPAENHFLMGMAYYYNARRIGRGPMTRFGEGVQWFEGNVAKGIGLEGSAKRGPIITDEENKPLQESQRLLESVLHPAEGTSQLSPQDERVAKMVLKEINGRLSGPSP